MKTKFEEFLNESIFDWNFKKIPKKIDKSELNSLEDIIRPILDELEPLDIIVNKTGKGRRISQNYLDHVKRVCDVLNAQLRWKKIVLNCVKYDKNFSHVKFDQEYDKLKEERELIKPYFSPLLEYVLICASNPEVPHEVYSYISSVDDIRNALAPIGHRIFNEEDPYGEEEWD